MNEYAFILKNYNWIKTNDKKTVFFNSKTGKQINVVCNSRCYGIWVKKGKFLALSKIEIKPTNKFFFDSKKELTPLEKIINDLESNPALPNLKTILNE